jgi:hypothetical protein
MDFIIPGEGSRQLVTIDFTKARMSDYLRRRIEEETGVPDVGRFLMGLECASKSDYLENKVLDHCFSGKTEFTKPQPYLALCTVVPEDGKTGSTITEAGYTGYARLKLEAASMNAAASGSSKNGSKLEFAACTASSSTIIGWATCDALTVGNMLYWGTATSTVISTTQTPATIAVEGLVGTED